MCALVAEGRNGDVDPGRAVGGGLGLGELDRPTRVHILLCRLGRLVGPDIPSAGAGLDRLLLAIGVALARRRHQGGVDDLPRHRQIAGLVETDEQPVQSLGADQGLAEIPQRVGVRHRVAGTKTAEPHPAQAVADQIGDLLQRQAMQGLQHQHLEFQHHVEAGPAALRRIAPSHRLGQNPAEDLEIDRRRQLLQRIALGGKLRQTVLNVPEARLPLHALPLSTLSPKGNHDSPRGASFRRCPDWAAQKSSGQRIQEGGGQVGSRGMDTAAPDPGASAFMGHPKDQ